MIACPRIVLTGGPGGGKTALMRELRTEDRHARRWLLVPEVAPLLFQVGLAGREKRFQRAVVRLQMALEEVCLCVHTWSGHPRYVLIGNAGRDWPAKTRAVRDLLACVHARE